MHAKDPNGSFYEEKKTVTPTIADATGASENRWSKGKTIPLFNEVDEKGSYASVEQHYRHFYNVVGTIYRRKAQDASLKKIKQSTSSTRQDAPK
jgi:hypothetical protein